MKKLPKHVQQFIDSLPSVEDKLAAEFAATAVSLIEGTLAKITDRLS
jgi:hypothetical protein